MRFSISTAFILLAFTHAASVVTASPVNNNNGGKQGGNGNNNNNAANNGNANNNNAQTSLQLDPSVIGPNLAKNGLNNGNGTEAGQAASITSTNNFINSCVGKTITNGLQNPTGSCNPVPMGDIPSSKNTPSCKFTTPANFGTVKANTAFDVTMAITGMQTGAFTNPNTNYFAAPQQLNKQGQIIGHSHFVIQSIKGLQDTAPADPTVFAFFQGLNAAAVKGQLTATVKKGLPLGTYRVFSINTAANHQPVIGPVAQHGSFDDAIYITVTADGKAAAGGNAGAANAAAGGNAGAANAAGGNAGAANAAAGKAGAANAAAGTNAGKASASASAGNKSSASSSQKAQATNPPQNVKSAQNGKANSATNKTATAKGAKATNSAQGAKATNSAKGAKATNSVKGAQASNSAQGGKGSNMNMNMNMNDKSRNKQARRDRRFASERNA